MVEPTQPRAPKASVTIRDVARLAGVSASTVSNVLNQPGVVTPAKRALVEQAIARLNFVPNNAARHLAAGRSKSLGLVLLDLANPFFLAVARGVEDVAAEAGYVVMLFNSADSKDREERALRVLLEHRVSGVLMSPVGAKSDTVARLRGDGIRVVLLDRSGPNSECSVAVDDERGGRLAAEHLLALGHSRLVFVRGATHLRQHNARLKGVQAAMREAGLPDSALDVIRDDMTVEGGRRAGKRIAELRPRPTGVLCGNDLLAVGVEQVLLDLGVAVPTEVAIVGYDDVEVAAVTAVPLTSVQQPMYAMGRAATELLISEIEDSDHKHQRIQFTPLLIPRASSAV